jgi:hypothetical protein
MTVTDTRVQVQRKGTTKFVTIKDATVAPAESPDYLRITLPTTLKLNPGDLLRTVFRVVTP